MDDNRIKEQEFETGIPGVELRFLKKMIHKLTQNGFKDDDLLSFEFLVGSCFPDAYDTLQETIRTQYTYGYIQGLTESGNLVDKELS